MSQRFGRAGVRIKVHAVRWVKTIEATVRTREMDRVGRFVEGRDAALDSAVTDPFNHDEVTGVPPEVRRFVAEDRSADRSHQIVTFPASPSNEFADRIEI